MILGLIARRLKYRSATASLRGKVIKLELADSALKRAIGLMYRDGLGTDNGMLFIFGRDGRPGIWMRNMRFPIDIAWLDKRFRIVDFVEKAKPCTDIRCKVYKPAASARYVLEFGAGTIRARGIRVGDTVRIKLHGRTARHRLQSER